MTVPLTVGLLVTGTGTGTSELLIMSIHDFLLLISPFLPSWVHSDEDRRQEEYDRIEQEFP
jgi:hypothetical protein